MGWTEVAQAVVARHEVMALEFLEFLSSCWLPAGQGRGSTAAALLQYDVYSTVLIICAVATQCVLCCKCLTRVAGLRVNQIHLLTKALLR